MKWTMKVKKLFVAFMLCEIKTKQTTNRGWWQVIAGTGKVKETRKPLM